jgi:Rieske Fe-S protein
MYICTHLGDRYSGVYIYMYICTHLGDRYSGADDKMYSSSDTGLMISSVATDAVVTLCEKL